MKVHVIRNGLVAVALIAMLAGCGIAQKGALIGARKAVNQKNYEACLAKVAEAESYGKFSDGETAQISFYRGFCLESLGRKAEAAAVYQNLIQNFPDTDWAAQARGRTSALR